MTIANFGLVLGLIIGTVYWLAVASRLEGNALPMRRALRIADGAEYPMLFAVSAATLGVISLIVASGWSLSNSVAGAVTLLAALEYVNYYHFQLQHFDNARDWQGLLRGKGFRPAHLARELARWRRINLSSEATDASL
ncbi:hypothetical protein [Sphingomonas oligophenolica]|uniref:hypothetical protein n=1 Tax=Sphingomonas oligophenolica TaxID=301154 RepID=UPI001125B4E1|nr:hypothetical protein [Sphingomonas oligophenolica]